MTMGAIRKTSRTRQTPEFRRRLQRALSLSSSEPEYSRSPSRSLSGDATEEEPSSHSNKNDQAVPQQGDPPNNLDHGVLPTSQYGGNVSQPGDSNKLNLTCLAELDVRVKSLDSKLTDQNECIEDFRRDLADLFRRLEVIETEAEERTKINLTHTPNEREQKIVQTRRSQRR